MASGNAAGLPERLGPPEPDGRPFESVVDRETEELPRHVGVAPRKEADAASVKGVEVASVDALVLRSQGDGLLEAVDRALGPAELEEGGAEEGPCGSLARVRLDALAQATGRFGVSGAGEVGAAEEEEARGLVAALAEVAAEGLYRRPLLAKGVAGPAEEEVGFGHGVASREEEGEELGGLSVVAFFPALIAASRSSRASCSGMGHCSTDRPAASRGCHAGYRSDCPWRVLSKKIAGALGTGSPLFSLTPTASRALARMLCVYPFRRSV